MKRPFNGRASPGKRRRGNKPEIDIDEIVKKKTFYHIKLLRKAVKKAKQFECGKAVRRLKQARESNQNEAEVKKFENTLAHLRVADVERLANIAAASVDLIDNEESNKNIAEIVQQIDKKILSHKCVVEQLEASVTALQSVKEKRVAKKSKPTAEKEDNSEEDEKDKKKEEDNEQEPNEEALQALEKLLKARKPSKIEEESDEDGDSGVIEDISDFSDIEMSPQDDDKDDEEQDSQEELPKQQQKMKQQLPAKKKKEPKKPKNRLGQRARRKLAEKVHGNNAVHVQQEKSAPPKREKPREQKEEALHPSWAARRQQKEKLSISAVAPAGKKIVFGGGDNSAPFAAQKRDKKKGSEKEKGEKGLHPSWELKKQQQDQQQMMAPAQGKKIVFDDSD